MSRHSEHATTQLANGTVVHDDLHITADFVDSKPIRSADHVLSKFSITAFSLGETGVGRAAHIYVDKDLTFKSLKLLGNVQRAAHGK